MRTSDPQHAAAKWPSFTFSKLLLFKLLQIATSMLTRGVEARTTARRRKTNCCARFKASCQHAGGNLHLQHKARTKAMHMTSICVSLSPAVVRSPYLAGELAASPPPLPSRVQRWHANDSASTIPFRQNPTNHL